MRHNIREYSSVSCTQFLSLALNGSRYKKFSFLFNSWTNIQQRKNLPFPWLSDKTNSLEMNYKSSQVHLRQVPDPNAQSVPHTKGQGWAFPEVDQVRRCWKSAADCTPTIIIPSSASLLLTSEKAIFYNSQVKTIFLGNEMCHNSL